MIRRLRDLFDDNITPRHGGILVALILLALEALAAWQWAH